MAYQRIAIPADEWPAFDQAAWSRAFCPADPLDDPGPAAHWRTKTCRTVETHYGFWLAYLRRYGVLEPGSLPAARASRINLRGYVAELEARKLSSITIAGYIRDLKEALRVMQPGVVLTELDHLLPRLEARATPSRVKRLRIVSPLTLLDAAVKKMKLCDRSHRRKASRRNAGAYRDAFIVAFLATRPVRLENLTAIEIDRHLHKTGEIYHCRFSAPEMKEHVALEFPLPEDLTPWLDRYLSIYRPLLLRGVETPRLWISTRSTPMVDNSIYCRMVEITKRLVGRPINPHLFRDCVASFIAEHAPVDCAIASRILGHADLRTCEAHYNQAGMVSAQLRHIANLERIRGDKFGG